MNKIHLEFTYNLVFYQTIDSKRNSFLNEENINHPIRNEFSMGLFANEKIEFDIENETLTVHRDKEYIKLYGGPESYNLTFRKYIFDKIWGEYDELISDIDSSYWKYKKTEFEDFLEKIQLHIDFIKKKTGDYFSKYLDENKTNESFEYITNQIFYLVEDIKKHLDDKYSLKPVVDSKIEHSKIDTSKKQLLKLIAESKIDELFKSLTESEILMDHDNIIMLSSRWNKISRDVNKGILDRDKYDLEFNKIIKSLVEFVKSLD